VVFFIRKKIKSFPPKDDLYHWPDGSGEEVENVNVYRQTTDKRRSEKLEFLTQVS
jgi:hypothetical protein